MLKKIKIIYCALALFFAFQGLNAQNTNNPAILRFYRTDKMLCNKFNFDIQFSKRDVHTLKPNLKHNSSLEYKIFSQGPMLVTIKNWMNDWTSNTTLYIENGRTYYIKIDCSLSGMYISTNDANGTAEWEAASKNNLTSLSEDIKMPFIVKEEEETEAKSVSTTTVVRVDTVKQIVYVQKSNKFSFEPASDVDTNIPSIGSSNELKFALIIGNEDYSTYQSDLKSEVNVDFAKNDASAFKEYAIKTMGIPEKNINLILDGTYGQMNQAISKINLIAKNTGGKAQIVFYYAGHGMPDETTKEPYLIPVDISGSNVSHGIKLKDLYSKLSEYPTEKTLVFIDACFSGGARHEGLIVGRSISIKPKEQLIKGNMVVFNSSSGQQSSLSYADKKHGIYTYFLLKKIQESGGELSLKELSTYLKEKVALESLLINNKEQSPQTNVSNELSGKWEKWNLK